MILDKYHALGNDYLVLAADPTPVPPPAEVIQLICHRNFGPGGDGILFGPTQVAEEGTPERGGLHGLRIFNPDGSEAEKSGNGLRIFARYLVDQGYEQEDRPFAVQTAGGRVACHVHAGKRQVTVEMGQASFDNTKIPLRGPTREALHEAFPFEGHDWPFHAVTVGNPHAVFLVDEPTSELAHRLGPIVEVDSRFPQRTNVQFAKVIDRQNVKIEIWERGAGYTLASGTSSCAVASVARRLGLIEPEVTLHMPGGQMAITVAEDFSLTMKGPVTRIARIDLDEEIAQKPE